MEKKGKKYVIRESELKEIIAEMILLESVDPNMYQANFVNGQPPKSMPLNQYLKKGLNLIKGIPDALVPDDWKERIAKGDNSFLTWLAGSAGLNLGGQAAADYVPDMRNWRVFGGNYPTSGNNGDAHEIFYVDVACAWLLTHATPYYIKGKNGHCGIWVRTALNEAGMTAPWGMWNIADSAKGYIRILPANGWGEISASEAGQKGDILVIDECTTIDTKGKHPHGHIAMCCGPGLWVADYRHGRGNITGLRGTPPQDKVHFYRYTGPIQPGPMPRSGGR